MSFYQGGGSKKKKRAYQPKVDKISGLRLRVWNSDGDELTKGQDYYIRRPRAFMADGEPNWEELIFRMYPEIFVVKFGERRLIGKYTISKKKRATVIFDI